MDVQCFVWDADRSREKRREKIDIKPIPTPNITAANSETLLAAVGAASYSAGAPHNGPPAGVVGVTPQGLAAAEAAQDRRIYVGGLPYGLTEVCFLL